MFEMSEFYRHFLKLSNTMLFTLFRKGLLMDDHVRIIIWTVLLFLIVRSDLLGLLTLTWLLTHI